MSEHEQDNQDIDKRLNAEKLFISCLGITLDNMGAVDGPKTAAAFLRELYATIQEGIKRQPAGTYDLNALSTKQVLLEGAVNDAERYRKRMIGKRGEKLN